MDKQVSNSYVRDAIITKHDKIDSWSNSYSNHFDRLIKFLVKLECWKYRHWRIAKHDKTWKWTDR